MEKKKNRHLWESIDAASKVKTDINLIGVGFFKNGTYSFPKVPVRIKNRANPRDSFLSTHPSPM